MAALGAAWPGASAARDCAGRDAAALQLDRTLSLAARDTQHLDISLGTAGEHLVLVIEDGIDVVAWVAAEPGIRPTPADAALARRGVQRFVVTVAEPTRLRLTVRGKEHAHARGRVRILHRPLDRGCAALLRVLSEAQAAYARAELVTRGLDPGATDDVPAEYRRAGDKLAEAAARAQSQAPESTASRAALQGEILLELAIARYVEGGRWAESADAAARAMSALQAAGDRYGEASALTRRAIALMEVARAGRAPYSPEAVRLQREARALLSRAIDLHAAHGERYEQALAQNNLGLSLFYEGRIPEALAAYQAALRLHEQLDEPPRRAQVLQNIALARLDLGQFSEAVHEYDQVLELLDAAAQPVLYASVLNNSALANAVAGNIDTALDRYSAALEIWIGLQNVREQARSRNGLGYVYYLAGDYDLAFEFYEQALALRTVELDPAGRASTLRTLGNLNRMLGRVERALALHREAFTLATTPIARNSALIQIARDFAAEGNHDRAIGLLDAVLAGDGVDVLTVAHARLDLGRSLAARGNRRAAVVELEAALALFRDHHLLAEEIECLIELARLGRAAGALDHALDLLDQAMVAADGLRMHSANPEMQASLTRPGRRAADLMIDLLLETGATPLGALSVAERARARVLAEIDAARDRPRAGGSTHAQRRESLYRTLAERRYEFQRVAGLHGRDDPRAHAVLAELTRARASLDRLNRIAPGDRARDTSSGMRALIGSLPEDACIVAYWFTATSVHAWTVTRSSLEWHVLGDSGEVEAAAAELHAAFQSFRTTSLEVRRRLAQRLYDTIVRPLDPACLGKRTLYFVPDGALHYTPFAALVDGAGGTGAYLVERYDVALLPALSLVRPQETLERTPRLLLVSDPVYGPSDERFLAAQRRRVGPEARAALRSSARHPDHVARLPGTALEAQRIAALFAGSGAITALSGFAATRDAFLAADLESYTHVHIATHGSFDPGAPRLSSLLLSRLDPAGRALEGRVWAGDFAALRFSADLLVLSGCETALGRHVRGEGLMGLQYLALGRGARAVIASMWGVPDRDAAELIAAMYAHLLGRRLAPHQALSAAIRERLQRDALIDPAHWAAFGVMTTEIRTDTPRNPRYMR